MAFMIQIATGKLAVVFVDDGSEAADALELLPERSHRSNRALNVVPY
jgi:hypothetical protein